MKRIYPLLPEPTTPTNLPGANVEMPLVYCSRNKDWFTTNERGRWIAITETAARRMLKEAGFSTKPTETVSGVDAEFNRRMRQDDVDFAGKLAGWPAGVHEVHGVRFLVTDAVALPPPEPVPWDNLREVMVGILGGEQFRRFLCWLHFRRKSVRDSDWLPGQALFLVGPAGAGKSFTQQLVTDALGGRVAKAWRYLSGNPFNMDLIGAEHLCVEDDSPCRDIQTRRSVGNQIKTMLYGRIQSAHGKGVNALSLEPHWALTASLNDEPENLLVIPPIDDSLRDKLMILKCHPAKRIVPPGFTEQRWLGHLLRTELPGLLAEADRIEVPAEWRDPRSGVAGWQHLDVLEVLEGFDPEIRLRELIDEHVVDVPYWQGSAMDLERLLRDKADFEMRQLAKGPHCIGRYLKRLAKADSQRFQPKRTAARNLWRIRPAANPAGGVEAVEGLVEAEM